MLIVLLALLIPNVYKSYIYVKLEVVSDPDIKYYSIVICLLLVSVLKSLYMCLIHVA